MADDGGEPSIGDLVSQIGEMQKQIDEQKTIIEGQVAQAKEYESTIKAKDGEIAKLQRFAVEHIYTTEKRPDKGPDVRSESEMYSDLLKQMKR